MLRQFRNIYIYRRWSFLPVINANRTFLTNDYKCEETWNSTNVSSLVNKINVNDFYNEINQTHSSKGVISAIDVDLFAHAVKDTIHLEELKDLLHKLRLSAETGCMLESTAHATIRNFIKFGYVQELIEILKDPLNFGVFLDDYTANMLMDDLLKSEKFEQAATVASLIMLQEEYKNELTSALCHYAAYKYITSYVPPEPAPPPQEKPKKVEEIKIRIKFLRNPYDDDHFDIKDLVLLSGKTLAWVSGNGTDNLNINLQLLGWLFYKKHDKLLSLSEQVSKSQSFKMYNEVLELLAKEKQADPENITLEKCIAILKNVGSVEITLEESLQIAVENAINKVQKRDIESQQKLFQSWKEIREQKLLEQTKRLNRAKRMQTIEQQQKQLSTEEQKLWFFDNEDQIDLEVEKKENLVEKPMGKKKNVKLSDDKNYIPPEILPKRK